MPSYISQLVGFIDAKCMRAECELSSLGLAFVVVIGLRIYLSVVRHTSP